MPEFLNYKKWILISIYVHVGVLSAFILANKIGFLMRHPIVISGSGIAGSINVDVVGLPNVLKRDLDSQLSTKKEMELPDSSIKESKKSAIQKIKEALSQESSYLKKLKIIKGLKTNIGGVQAAGATVGGTDNADPYFNTIKQYVRTYWKIPGWMKSEGLNALVTVKIDQAGNITSAEISKASGNTDFDSLALSSVKNAAPFPTPPVSVRDTLENGVVLSFP